MGDSASDDPKILLTAHHCAGRAVNYSNYDEYILQNGDNHLPHQSKRLIDLSIPSCLFVYTRRLLRGSDGLSIPNKRKKKTCKSVKKCYTLCTG